MLIFCDFIQVYVLTTNHHLNQDIISFYSYVCLFFRFEAKHKTPESGQPRSVRPPSSNVVHMRMSGIALLSSDYPFAFTLEMGMILRVYQA